MEEGFNFTSQPYLQRFMTVQAIGLPVHQPAREPRAESPILFEVLAAGELHWPIPPIADVLCQRLLLSC